MVERIKLSPTDFPTAPHVNFVPTMFVEAEATARRGVSRSRVGPVGIEERTLRHQVAVDVNAGSGSGICGAGGEQAHTRSN